MVTNTTMPMSMTMSVLPPQIRRFVSVSYPVSGGLYDKGRDDVLFAATCAVVWTILRHVCMTYILAPLASAVIPEEKIPKSAKGALLRHEQRLAAKRRGHNIIRFAEQAWGMLYCTVFFALGVIILRRIPNALSPEQVWGTYPYTPLPYLTKWYYLAQLGWWFHQVYAINTEKRRKDYWQMFGHHILTIALIVSSYAANYTRVGVIVHVIMDTADIFLPLAKLLRYMDLRQACDCAFVAFLLTWIVTRQIGLFLVIRSAYVEGPKYIPFKWAHEEGIYFTKPIYYSFVVLLSLLLALCTVWFYMAIMVAVRVVTGKGAEDVRSDSEEEDEISVDGDESDASSVAGFSNGTNVNGTNGVASGRATPNGNSNGYANGHAYTNGFTNGHSPASSLGSANGLKQRK
ncbi:hypothetical protein CcaverHIS002_0601770 [Cutaneotrichosporon cavernicola]|nr:hypothetical protein CcaverHIS002_0601770 [Cutaneotrichosporon cavernicola]BEJ00332.1 hypothetical protein CcaverHIS631_0501890 [Cutaneotrichosporon cavernicola]BEJ08102.1 hypothetical protein CcaverHIS641_0501870 [Cutaneotrichosporon cavernicola]